MLVTPTFIEGIPVTSALVYKSLQHWGALESHSEDSLNRFRTISNSLLAVAIV